MAGYLIYHPPRCKTNFDDIAVYHDSINGNQDPYIWNDRFLHTYCHITQMKPNVGDINFWVSGDIFPHFSHLYCDLVFVVEKKLYWHESNHIDPDDDIIDTEESHNDHYRWYRQHYFKKRKRYTLKADSARSFQPQDSEKKLIDIIPFLIEQGQTIEDLRQGLRAGISSKPMRLEAALVSNLNNWIRQNASIELKGIQLQNLRKCNPKLASPLVEKKLEADYRAAASEDDAIWDVTVGDGLSDETWGHC